MKLYIKESVNEYSGEYTVELPSSYKRDELQDFIDYVKDYVENTDYIGIYVYGDVYDEEDKTLTFEFEPVDDTPIHNLDDIYDVFDDAVEYAKKDGALPSYSSNESMAYNLDNAESRRKEIADRFDKKFTPDDHILRCKDDKELNIQVGKKYKCTACNGQRVEIVSIDDIYDDNSATVTALYRGKMIMIGSTQLYESKMMESEPIREDALDDILSDNEFRIPDIPEDYLHDVVEYGVSIGLKRNQFDYDNKTKTVIITYSPYDRLGNEKCGQVLNWTKTDMYKDADDIKYTIPDIPEDYDYINDIIQYGISVGLKEYQFDYDYKTETLIITYNLGDDIFGDRRCEYVHDWVLDNTYEDFNG